MDLESRCRVRRGAQCLLYANVSTGFKSGGFNGANTNLKSQQSSYWPEQKASHEAGVKAIHGYGLVDGSVSFGPEDGRWSTGIWGENIFNKYYYVYAGLPANSNYVRGVGLPATYSVRIGAAP